MLFIDLMSDAGIVWEDSLEVWRETFWCQCYSDLTVLNTFLRVSICHDKSEFFYIFKKYNLWTRCSLWDSESHWLPSYYILTTLPKAKYKTIVYVSTYKPHSRSWLLCVCHNDNHLLHYNMALLNCQKLNCYKHDGR